MHESITGSQGPRKSYRRPVPMLSQHLLLAGFLASSAAPAPELPVFRASGVATPTRSRVELPGRFLRGSSGGGGGGGGGGGRHSGGGGGDCEGEGCGECDAGCAIGIVISVLVPLGLVIGILVWRKRRHAAQYQAKAEECLAQGYDRRKTTARQMAVVPRSSYARAWICDLCNTKSFNLDEPFDRCDRSGVDICHACLARRGVTPAPDPEVLELQRVAQPVIAQPAGVQIVQCGACRQQFGVPAGTRVAACPHCGGHNQLA